MDSCRVNRHLLLLAISLLMLASSGCAGFGVRSKAAEALAECRDYACRGATALEVGQWQQAEELLRKAVDGEPSDGKSRRHLAETLWQQDQHSEAIAHMRLAVKNEPEDATLVVRLGEMLLDQRKLQEAKALGERAVALDDRNPRTWALRGLAYHELGESQRGLADLQQALRLAPEDRETLASVARIYAQRGMPQRQLTTLHRLADTYPPGELPPSLLSDEGAAYMALARPAMAVERLRLAAASGGGSAGLLYRLAEAEEATGHRTAAVAAARQALTVDATHSKSQQFLAKLSETEIATAPTAPARR